MNNLRRLGSALILTFVLGISTFAGEIPTPPCAPGEIPTPPCASEQLINDDSALSGQTETPPASESIDIFSLAEIGLRSLFLF